MTMALFFDNSIRRIVMWPISTCRVQNHEKSIYLLFYTVVMMLPLFVNNLLHIWKEIVLNQLHHRKVNGIWFTIWIKEVWHHYMCSYRVHWQTHFHWLKTSTFSWSHTTANNYCQPQPQRLFFTFNHYEILHSQSNVVLTTLSSSSIFVLGELGNLHGSDLPHHSWNQVIINHVTFAYSMYSTHIHMAFASLKVFAHFYIEVFTDVYRQQCRRKY